MPIMSSIFLIGQILEWKYNISYPFSEIQDSHNKKKNLVYGVIGFLLLGTLITALVLTFNSNFAKTFVAFLAILFICLVTLFIITIAEGLQKLFYCSNTPSKQTIPQNDQVTNGDAKGIEVQEVKDKENNGAKHSLIISKKRKLRFSSFQRIF